MIHLKCTVVRYANLSSSSINKPFLKNGPLNMLVHFFQFPIMFIFMRLLSKTLQKRFFQYKFLKFISKCSILQNIRMPNIVILTWWPFEFKAEFEKASFV